MSLDIKKINVRSPYYITVGVPNSKLQPDEIEDPVIPENNPNPDPDVDATETVIPISDKECGKTYKFGTTVGSSKHRYPTSGRIDGDYVLTISLNGYPMEYRIGTESNINSTPFVTIGNDTFTEEWEAAGGDSTNLRTPPSTGDQSFQVSATYTYGSSDSGDVIVELRHIIPSRLSYSISVNCPAVDTPLLNATGDYITVISVVTKSVTLPKKGCLLYVNNVQKGFSYNGISPDLSLVERQGVTFRKTVSGSLFPASSDSDFLNTRFNQTLTSKYGDPNTIFDDMVAYDSTSLIEYPQVTTEAIAANSIIQESQNVIKVQTEGNFGNNIWEFFLIVTSHKIVDDGGTLKISGTDQGDVSGVITSGRLKGNNAYLELTLETGSEGRIGIRNNAVKKSDAFDMEIYNAERIIFEKQ